MVLLYNKNHLHVISTWQSKLSSLYAGNVRALPPLSVVHTRAETFLTFSAAYSILSPRVKYLSPRNVRGDRLYTQHCNPCI